MTKQELDKIYENGKWAWPGGYEILLIMDDGKTVCFDCAVANRSQIEAALEANWNDGWKPASGVLAEEMDLSPGEAVLCAHCNRVITQAEEEEEVCC